MTWGESVIEQKPRFVYTHRWERWLAVVWPPKRRKLAMMNLLAEKSLTELQQMRNRITADLVLYGTSYISLGTQSGTSILAEEKNPQNPGSKPENNQ